MSQDIVVQRPDAPKQLVLVQHGVGSSAANMQPLAQHIAAAFTDAWVVSVDAALPSDMGGGRQWFSVRGVTEDNRPDRVAAAMPAFLASIAHWQAEAGVGPRNTTLIGFSQGAIMSLESLQSAQAPALRVVSLAGRFAKPPTTIAQGAAVHLVHGSEDPVIAVAYSIQAQSSLKALGAQATFDLIPGLAHGVDMRVVEATVKRMQGD